MKNNLSKKYSNLATEDTLKVFNIKPSEDNKELFIYLMKEVVKWK